MQETHVQHNKVACPSINQSINQCNQCNSRVSKQACVFFRRLLTFRCCHQLLSTLWKPNWALDPSALRRWLHKKRRRVKITIHILTNVAIQTFHLNIHTLAQRLIESPLPHPTNRPYCHYQRTSLCINGELANFQEMQMSGASLPKTICNKDAYTGSRKTLCMIRGTTSTNLYLLLLFVGKFCWIHIDPYGSLGAALLILLWVQFGFFLIVYAIGPVHTCTMDPGNYGF